MDFVDRSFGVHGFQTIALAVELDDRLGLPSINVEPVADYFFVVVVTLNQFAAGRSAFVDFFGRREKDIQQLPGH